MEGKKIYTTSEEELAKIRKSLGTDTTVINWDKLDERTKHDLNRAVTDVVLDRQKEVQKITLGVQ